MQEKKEYNHQTNDDCFSVFTINDLFAYTNSRSTVYHCGVYDNEECTETKLYNKLKH
jgi:hypothetical protein